MIKQNERATIVSKILKKANEGKEFSRTDLLDCYGGEHYTRDWDEVLESLVINCVLSKIGHCYIKREG